MQRIEREERDIEDLKQRIEAMKRDVEKRTRQVAIDQVSQRMRWGGGAERMPETRFHVVGLVLKMLVLG